jgi:hypothetical protein
MGKIVRAREHHALRSYPRPAGDEGLEAGGWGGLTGSSPKLALDEALAAGAFLLGRRSYEWLAARWPSRSGELAGSLNGLPRYVVSATLANPAWPGSISEEVGVTERPVAVATPRALVTAAGRSGVGKTSVTYGHHPPPFWVSIDCHSLIVLGLVNTQSWVMAAFVSNQYSHKMMGSVAFGRASR